jgi:endonuclease/exonuclease/phosphatase (EEP) superfamily protein YafD
VGVRTVAHLHGLWNGQGKGDSPDRLLQSDNIVHFLQSLDGPHIFCGDLNLLPDTESLKKLEAAGMRNLIKEFGITSTRSSLYTKPLRFADYMFVSGGIKVKDFKVLPDEVSDHLALYLEFS